MAKLWEKDWKLNEEVESFETKDDLEMDQKLAKFDIYGSIAQTKMLNKIGLLTKDETDKAIKGFSEILLLIEKDKFKLSSGDEDVHTKIENFITEKYGEVGKKIHTGRSRSDQVLTDIRLYTKSRIIDIWKELLKLSRSFYIFSEKYEFVPMPGYTHMQKAMLSSVGMWSSAFLEAFLEDVYSIKVAFEINDKSPLGSAASYGVPLYLDREYMAGILGFARIQKNSLNTHNSRIKIESGVISGLIPILMDINRFASDIMLFTTSEYGYFNIDKSLCSGSSIMPQKKNVDAAELLRSKIHLLIGYYIQSVSIPNNLSSGYSRDFQDGKKPLFMSLDLTLECIRITNIIINGIEPNIHNLNKAITPELFATYNAIKMTSKGESFRDAYRIIGNSKKYNKPQNIKSVLNASTHLGGTGNLDIKSYFKNIVNEEKLLKIKSQKFEDAIEKLIYSR